MTETKGEKVPTKLNHTADDSGIDLQELTLLVEFLPPKPNPFFTEEQHRATSFIRYSKPVPCAECGRRRKVMWTQRWSFCVMEESTYTLRPSAKIHIPGTPVCTSHILGAALLPPPERKKKKPKAA
jgi:hypothetical protein